MKWNSGWGIKRMSEQQKNIQQIELNVGNARFINDNTEYQQANGILASKLEACKEWKSFFSSSFLLLFFLQFFFRCVCYRKASENVEIRKITECNDNIICCSIPHETRHGWCCFPWNFVNVSWPPLLVLLLLLTTTATFFVFAYVFFRYSLLCITFVLFRCCVLPFRVIISAKISCASAQK